MNLFITETSLEPINITTMFQENRQSLVVVLLESLSFKQLGKELSYLLTTITYLDFTKRKQKSEELDFWRKLKWSLTQRTLQRYTSTSSDDAKKEDVETDVSAK